MAAKKGNKYAKGNKGGRKTLYKAEFADQAYSLALLGFTDKEFADSFGVTEGTIQNWKKDHKEFLSSIKRGRIIADGQIAENLYKRARGYSYDEVHFEKVDLKDSLEDSDIEDLKIDVFKKKVITKEVAPDVTAQIFWLKNRQPQLWRDKQSTELTGKDGKDLFKGMSDEELEVKIKDLEAKKKLIDGK